MVFGQFGHPGVIAVFHVVEAPGPGPDSVRVQLMVVKNVRGDQERRNHATLIIVLVSIILLFLCQLFN